MGLSINGRQICSFDVAFCSPPDPVHTYGAKLSRDDQPIDSLHIEHYAPHSWCLR